MCFIAIQTHPFCKLIHCLSQTVWNPYSSSTISAEIIKADSFSMSASHTRDLYIYIHYWQQTTKLSCLIKQGSGMVRERNIKETLKRENSKEEKRPCKYKKKHAHGLQKTDQEAGKPLHLSTSPNNAFFRFRTYLGTFF